MEENEQTDVNKWIVEELKQVEEQAKEYEEAEAFKPVENKQEIIAIDISKPWERWIDSESSTIKKKIFVTHEGTRKLFWINTRNPLYKQLLERAGAAVDKGEHAFVVKILRTGTQKNTRYILVE